MKILGVGVIALAVLGIGFFALSSPSDPENTTKTVASDQSAIDMDKIQAEVANGALLLDVRTPAEYQTMHYEGATNFPLGDMQMGMLPEVNKDTAIYVYCQSGNRSSQAKDILKAEGYTKIIDLGGLTDVKSIGGTPQYPNS